MKEFSDTEKTMETKQVRISRLNMYFEFAKVVSRRSTCTRANVGCVAVVDKRVIAMGYNGSLPGAKHCDSDNCSPDKPCQNSVHAEANMIAYCAKQGIKLKGATIYCTHLPCLKCSELIIQAGITECLYLEDYRDLSGFFAMNKAKIFIGKYLPELDKIYPQETINDQRKWMENQE